MFEFIRQQLENDAISEIRKSITKVEYTRALKITHYMLFLSSGMLFFILILFFLKFIYIYPNYEKQLFLLGCIIVESLLVITQILKRNESFLKFLLKVYISAKRFIEQCKTADFLYHHFLATILLIYIPLTILIIISFSDVRSIVRAGTIAHQKQLDSINQLNYIFAVIIAAQIALFTFMFNQILSRYSSRIAGSVIKHRTVILLWSFPFLSLIIINIFYFLGFPKILSNFFAPYLFVLSWICIILTILTANTGIHTDKAIIYSSKYYKRRLKSVLKPCLIEAAQHPNKLWKLLSSFGLDWRDPSRYRFYEPPPKAVRLMRENLTSLLNAANKSIEENNHETLYASLYAIWNLMEYYTRNRKTYYGGSDSVFSFLNDQLSALVNASSKASNEYMITDIVKYIGNLGSLSFEISQLPEKPGLKNEKKEKPKEHILSGMWFDLLRESFQLSSSLMRSTAASEVINQIQNLCIKAYVREYYNVIVIGFIPAISNMHKFCLENPTLYRLNLAGDCMNSVIYVWAYSANRIDKFSGIHASFEPLLNTVKEMGKNQLPFYQFQLTTMNNAVTILTSKTTNNKFILQDIFYITLSRHISSDWEQWSTVQDLLKIIKLESILIEEMLEKKIYGVNQLTEALYEISYFILKGLPDEYVKKFDQNNKDIREELIELTQSFKPSNEQILEKELFETLRYIFPKIFIQEGSIGLDWEHYIFGMIGLGMVAYQYRRDDNLKSELLLTSQQIYSLIMKKHRESDTGIWENWWDYLQLLGAWINYFLNEADFAKQIGKDVAENRPFHYNGLGHQSGGDYGVLGYPTIHHNDFFLPWLRNLQSQQYLSESDWDTFRSWQEEVMKRDMLMAYYKIMEEIREPLRKKFYEEIRKSVAQRSKKVQHDLVSEEKSIIKYLIEKNKKVDSDLTFKLPTDKNKITKNDIDRNQLRVTVKLKKHFPSKNSILTVIISDKQYQTRFTYRAARSHIWQLGKDAMRNLGIKEGGKVKITRLEDQIYRIEKF